MSLQNVPPDESLIPSEKSYLVRLCKQTLKSTYEVSISQQLFMTGLIAIVGIPIGLYFGIVTSSLGWGYLLTALCTYGIALLIILFINALRAPFILDREQRQKIAGLGQRLIATEQRLGLTSNAPASQLLTPTPTAAPSLECKEAKFVKMYMDERDNTLSDIGAETEQVDVAIARFYYKPHVDSDPRIDVRAHIFFYDSNDEIKAQVFDAVWFKKEGKYASFSKGDARQLILALVGTEVIGVYECNYRKPDDYIGQYFSPTLEALEGKKFRIRVELIAESQNNIRLTKSFDFSLTLEPKPHLEEIKSDGMLVANTPSENAAKRAYIIEQLKNLLQEGRQYPPGIWTEITRESAARESAWRERAERFLARHFDESHVARFKEKGIDALEETLEEFLG